MAESEWKHSLLFMPVDLIFQDIIEDNLISSFMFKRIELFALYCMNHCL